MTRISKQEERRAVSPRKHRRPSPKTGSKRDKLEFGFKPHENAAPVEFKLHRFIPKIR